MRRCSAPSHTLPDSVQQLHVQQPFHVCKTKNCRCSFRLLMMGGVSPETCWASCKYEIKKCWYTVASCWISYVDYTMMHRSTNIIEMFVPTFVTFRCDKVYKDIVWFVPVYWRFVPFPSCFSTASRVAQTDLNVNLCIHCPSYWKYVRILSVLYQRNLCARTK